MVLNSIDDPHSNGSLSDAQISSTGGACSQNQSMIQKDCVQNGQNLDVPRQGQPLSLKLNGNVSSSSVNGTQVTTTPIDVDAKKGSDHILPISPKERNHKSSKEKKHKKHSDTRKHKSHKDHKGTKREDKANRQHASVVHYDHSSSKRANFHNAVVSDLAGSVATNLVEHNNENAVQSAWSVKDEAVSESGGGQKTADDNQSTYAKDLKTVAVSSSTSTSSQAVSSTTTSLADVEQLCGQCQKVQPITIKLSSGSTHVVNKDSPEDLTSTCCKYIHLYKLIFTSN